MQSIQVQFVHKLNIIFPGNLWYEDTRILPSVPARTTYLQVLFIANLQTVKHLDSTTVFRNAH